MLVACSSTSFMGFAYCLGIVVVSLFGGAASLVAVELRGAQLFDVPANE